MKKSIVFLILLFLALPSGAQKKKSETVQLKESVDSLKIELTAVTREAAALASQIEQLESTIKQLKEAVDKINPSPDYTVEDNSFFRDGLIKVRGRTGLYGYANEKGELVIHPQFEIAQPFSDGLAIIRKGDYYGAIDKTGKVIIPTEFDDLVHWSPFCVKAKKNGCYGLFDKLGNLVQDVKYYGIQDRPNEHNDRAAISTFDGCYGFVDDKGKLVIPIKYGNNRSPSGFSDGSAWVGFPDDKKTILEIDIYGKLIRKVQ